jgi:hypothetical protein
MALDVKSFGLQAKDLHVFSSDYFYNSASHFDTRHFLSFMISGLQKYDCLFATCKLVETGPKQG